MISEIFKKCSQFFLILALSMGWIFSGWPQVYNFPPAIEKAYAGSTIAYKSAGAGTMTETSGVDLTPLAPATVDAGDILIAHIVVLDASSALSTPAGWALLSGPSGLGVTETGRAWVYGKIADGSEDGAAINFGNLASTVGRLGRIYSFSGYSSGTINDVVPAASFTADGSETDPVIRQVTTSVSGAKAVALVSQDDNNTHNALGAVTGGTWAEAVADYTDTAVGAQGAALQIQVGTPTSDPGTIAGGTVAGTDDEANTFSFEIRSGPPVVTLSGTVTSSITEADIVAGSETIVLTTDGMFVPASAGAIQFVGGSVAGKAGVASGGANSTIALNSGLSGGVAESVASGDMVIAVFGTGSVADRTLAITDGSSNYTLIGSELYQDDTYDTNLRVAYKFMGGTPDASTTFGPTGNASDSGAMGVYVFRGVDPNTPLDVAAVPGQAVDTSRVVPPDITPSTAGAYVVIAGAAAHNGGADTFTSTDLIVDFTTTGGTNDDNDVSIGIGHIDNWTSGATNAATWGHSQTDATTFSWAAITLALRPKATTPFADARQDIIDGLDSAQAEGTGWDAVVKAGQTVANVVRTSDSIVTITLDAFASYNITAQETITGTVPTTALVGGNAVVASPTFTIGIAVVPTFEQESYEFFNNANSTDVGSELSSQDNPATLASAGDAFRLRILIHVGASQLGSSGQDFKLQFAEKSGTCDTGFSGESYADVTGATTIAYSTANSPSDGDNLTPNANDPSAGHTVVNQDYEEANNFTNTVAAIPSGQDGKWDFSLIDNGAPSNTSYCFRVRTSGDSALDTYTVIPEITTADSSPVYSVSITPSGVIEYGFVEIGNATSTVNKDYTKIVENDGNTTEKLNVKSSNATGGTAWTLAETIDTNKFKHEFSTTTGSAWTTMSAADTYVTAVPSLAQSGTATFDFRLTAPSASSDYQEKSIIITVQAVAP